MNTYNEKNVLRLGTRGSLLARMQSQIVADELEKFHPGLTVELVICKTTGDRVQDRPLTDVGGKGAFTKELEEALLTNEIDFAVHSFKDVPVTMPLVDPSKLYIAAVPPRLDARDVLISRSARNIRELRDGARVGTGSLRRKCQLLATRADLNIENVRGNIDTRLKKLHAGEYDAIILAAAGLKRAGMYDEREMSHIDVNDLIPSAGQGALALQCRRDDLRTRSLLAVLDDPTTARCVRLERAIIAAFNGDCHSPIAAFASISDSILTLRTAVGARDGVPPLITDEQIVDAGDPERAFVGALQSLSGRGALDLLQSRGSIASFDMASEMIHAG